MQNSSGFSLQSPDSVFIYWKCQVFLFTHMYGQRSCVKMWFSCNIFQVWTMNSFLYVSAICYQRISYSVLIHFFSHRFIWSIDKRKCVSINISTQCFVMVCFAFSRLRATTWWPHQMETFSALLALCAGNSRVTGEFPTRRPVTHSFDVFFDLNQHLDKQ